MFQICFREKLNYIPLWVFLIRNMSSLNCIYYENKNNSSSDIYEKKTIKIKSKIGKLLDDTNKIKNLEN